MKGIWCVPDRKRKKKASFGHPFQQECHGVVQICHIIQNFDTPMLKIFSQGKTGS